jgi:hypothetical protein
MRSPTTLDFSGALALATPETRVPGPAGTTGAGPNVVEFDDESQPANPQQRTARVRTQRVPVVFG